MKEFSKKAIKDIKLWAWLATVLPITSLAGLFFLEFIGISSNIRLLLTLGATLMFLISVVWWWWAIYTIATIAKNLSTTIDRFDDVKKDLKSIKNDLQK